jgi:uncharacterized protein (DUF1501 family)
MFAQLCSAAHFPRRSLLRAGAGLWLTPLAGQLARAAQRGEKTGRERPKSVIFLWLEGGASQLETFDPHPGTSIGGEVQAIETSAAGVMIANTLPATAEQMHRISLVRSVTSKEGDHARATYNVKTGFRPDPTLIHPSVGAIACHKLPGVTDIPRHISILPGNLPARGGYLGSKYDAFKVFDPAGPIPDVRKIMDDRRYESRVHDLLDVLEPEFARGRLAKLEAEKTMHVTATREAIRMMTSQQLDAFDVSQESQEQRRKFGDTPFGRSCLAAARLIEVGVCCVEISLGGWDSHVNNHALQSGACANLDPAFAALLARLAERELLETTLVVCGSEFGRTPTINGVGGRDHWPHGFSMALAGCGIRGGGVYGETSPKPRLDPKNPQADLKDPVTVADVQATILAALDIQWDHEMMTPVGRPMKFSEGTPIPTLLASQGNR